MSGKKMKKEAIGGAEVAWGSDNIFADLKRPNPAEHLLKSELVSQLRMAIESRGFGSQTEAAAALGLPQPHLSRLLRGRFEGVSVEQIINLLIAVGKGKVIIPTDAEIETTRRKSEKENAREIRALAVEFRPGERLIALRLVGRASSAPTEIVFAPEVSPALAAATDEQLAQLEVYPSGTTLALEALDLHLSVEGLILSALMGPEYHLRLRQHGASAMGKVTSEAKAKAVRENGKKGGHPRRAANA